MLLKRLSEYANQTEVDLILNSGVNPKLANLSTSDFLRDADTSSEVTDKKSVEKVHERSVQSFSKLNEFHFLSPFDFK